MHLKPDSDGKTPFEKKLRKIEEDNKGNQKKIDEAKYKYIDRLV
jgi:hypothetical protein